MTDLTLERFLADDAGTFGRLTLPDGTVLYTCEDEWRDNQPRVSCIPEGIYTLRPRRYQKGKYDTYEVTNVPGRSAILIHKGNTEEHTMGCILLGMGLGVVVVERDEERGARRRKQAVVRSGPAFDAFMRAMAGAPEAKLTITWHAVPGAGAD